MSTVDIILRKHIDGLGEEGDIKRVKRGLAQNYLIPKRLAIYKTAYALFRLEKEMDAIKKRNKERNEATKSIIEKMNLLEINFYEKVSSSGNLFGSIGKREILSQLFKIIPEEMKEYQMNRFKVKLSGSIKQIGSYVVEVGINNEFAKLNIHVLNQEKEKEKEEEERVMEKS